MKFLLDTNICIFLIKNNDSQLRGRFESLAVGDIGVSAVTLSELTYGAWKSAKPEHNLAVLRRFFVTIPVLAYDHRAAGVYGKIRTDLESKGTPIGPADTMIAAHAVSRSLCLVTNNTREFKRVSRLQLEDWTTTS